MDGQSPRTRSYNGLGQAARSAYLMMVPAIAALALWGAPAAHATTAEWGKNGVGLKTTEASTWKGSTTLNFVLAGGNFAATCEDTITGTVGPKGAAEMTKWEFSKCKSTGDVPCEGPSLEAEKLPWTTALTALEGIVHNVIPTADRLAIRCKGLYEWCNHLPNEILKNTEAGVRAEYNKSETIACSGSAHSHVEGHQEIALVSGGLLSVKHE